MTLGWFWNDHSMRKLTDSSAERYQGHREASEKAERCADRSGRKHMIFEGRKIMMMKFSNCLVGIWRWKKNFDDFEIRFFCPMNIWSFNCNLGCIRGQIEQNPCDWADMLYRMYSRWSWKRLQGQYTGLSSGDWAEIKSVTFLVEVIWRMGIWEGGRAFIWCISPLIPAGESTILCFSGCYAAVLTTKSIEIKPEDLIVETKRASGAGGRHINKTDSAVTWCISRPDWWYPVK